MKFNQPSEYPNTSCTVANKNMKVCGQNLTSNDAMKKIEDAEKLKADKAKEKKEREREREND